MSDTTTTYQVAAWQVQPSQRVHVKELGDIGEIRVKYVQHLSNEKVLLAGDVFRVGRSGSYQSDFLVLEPGEKVDVLGLFGL